jgi:AcrR family transcriptional regulator
MSIQKRKYELRARAERQADTRRRIAAATAELHEVMGPARTTVAEIARRAGVQRLTVYKNFPDEYDLFAACQRHFLTEHPPPDHASALAIVDPANRVEAVLGDLYRWYRRTERMSANVRRDREIVPALDSLMANTTDTRAVELADALAAGFADGRRPRRQVRAAVALALDFWTWRRLAKEGLGDRGAARLMTEAVLAAVGETAGRRQPPAVRVAPGGVEPPHADSKFGPEPRQAETHRDDRAQRGRFCRIVDFVISSDLGGSGGPNVAPYYLGGS